MEITQIKPKMRICGLESQPVTIVAIDIIGNSAELIYKRDDGTIGNQLISAPNAEKLQIDDSPFYSFDADPKQMRLCCEAIRIERGSLFDPFYAVHSSNIIPLPHQITAVYQEMLPRIPLRYLLADDPGAGKTIMAGLLIKELRARGDLNNCLIVAPGGLVSNWQSELQKKFSLDFKILTRDAIDMRSKKNVFDDLPFCIARLDHLKPKNNRDNNDDKRKPLYAENVRLQEMIAQSNFDLVIIDEAHKMSASRYGNEIRDTARYALGKRLAEHSRNLLLMTATPHNGNDDDFSLFMQLIDPDRFEIRHQGNSMPSKDDLSDVMRRLVKEKLIKFDGTPLFPARIAHTMAFELTGEELELYERVTDYVRSQFNRAENLAAQKRNNIGFALQVLQRRLASSPLAIYNTLKKRRQKLQDLYEKCQWASSPSRSLADSFDDIDAPYQDDDDMSAIEAEDNAENAVESLSTAIDLDELDAEIQTLQDLEKRAEHLYISGSDCKWQQLSALLQGDDNPCNVFASRETAPKLIVFTEHRDTLQYLSKKLEGLLGSPDAIVQIHGATRRDERDNIQDRFRQDKDVRILVATDAAGEGINLQSSHIVINYDLPWNPNRIEQRFGRVHRIGQTKTCYLYNLIAGNTCEGNVYKRLLQKLDEESNRLGNAVFDVLGRLTFGQDQSLKDLILESIQKDTNGTKKDEPTARIQLAIDEAFSHENLEKLIKENALTEEILDPTRVKETRFEMERAQAQKLAPYFIEQFMRSAFEDLNGTMQKRDTKPKSPAVRFEITRVPRDICSNHREVLNKYERICFDPQYVHIDDDAREADCIDTDHPLLRATLKCIIDKYSSHLKRGTFWIDPRPQAQDICLLFIIQDVIVDELGHSISQKIHFIDVTPSGNAQTAGFAPYNDYEDPDDVQREAIRQYLGQIAWPGRDVERNAIEFCSKELEKHKSEIEKKRNDQADRIEKAVRERLNAEINYCDKNAIRLRQAGNEGNAVQEEKKAADYHKRLTRRLAEIEKSRRLIHKSPVIIGAAIVVSKSFIDSISPSQTDDDATLAPTRNTKEVEKIAMDAVMEKERHDGFEPRDVSSENRGYDIESIKVTDKDSIIRFIEVKGRRTDADKVTVTYNERNVGKNKGENYILAIVRVDNDNPESPVSKITYIPNPFKDSDCFVTQISYDIDKLEQMGKQG